MKPSTKEKLKKLSAEADTVTDGVLFKISQLDYSWAYVIGIFAAGVVIGAIWF